MEKTLAERLGKTWHVSPLEMKLRRLQGTNPRISRETWLLTIAVSRGVTVVFPPRETGEKESRAFPDRQDLTNEELVTGILLLQRADQPQLLRAAAQLISRGEASPSPLLRMARRERTGPVLKALATLALRVDPDHRAWRTILEALPDVEILREPLLHWTRLAEPRMRQGRVNAEGWDLIQ